MCTHGQDWLLGTEQSIRKIIHGENRLSVSQKLFLTCNSSSMGGTCQFPPSTVAWLLVESCLLAWAAVLLRFHGHMFPFISRVYLALFYPILSHSGSEQGLRWLCAPQATGRGRESFTQGFSQTVQSTDWFCGPLWKWKHYSQGFLDLHFVSTFPFYRQCLKERKGKTTWFAS